MSNLSQEAQAIRERISRYTQPTQNEIDKILKIEFEFIQLLDLILRSYPLDARTQEALARLEESRIWAGLSVKRGHQEGYKQSDYLSFDHEVSSEDHLSKSQSLEPAFKVVLDTILNRCLPNREMDLAIARLNDTKSVLNLGAYHLSFR